MLIQVTDDLAIEATHIRIIRRISGGIEITTPFGEWIIPPRTKRAFNRLVRDINTAQVSGVLIEGSGSPQDER